MQTCDSPATRPEVTRSYFLGTGPLEYYYTLWSKTVVKGVGCFWRYRQNLAHDYNEAVTKATEMTRQTSWEQFDISEYKRQNAASPDFTLPADQVKLTFGKYSGQTVAEVEDADFNYLLFLALKSDWQPTQVKHARCLNYIKALYRPVAEQKEAAKVEARAAARAERDAARADLPVFTGRVTIEGSVISTKVVDSQYGPTTKMLVEHETGWKVWGTVPSDLLCITDASGGQRSLQYGDEVRFTASVQKSDKDPKFGFFNRPTKAVLLAAVDAPATAGAQVAQSDYGHFGGNYDAD